ncbi:MAG: alpha/beta fold hydrolase [Solirubrobacterales bacterium]
MAVADPLLLVHGFAQTPRSWQTVIDVLPAGRDLHAIELPGHGATALTLGPPSVESARAAMFAALDQIAADRVVVWGYSQGARVALDAVLFAPARFSAMILESGTAGIDDPLARADRRSRDVALASRIEAAPIEDFLDLWERIPALGEQSRALIESQRADRLAHDPVALAAALRGIGQSAYEPMWDRLGEIAVPTLLISGERDRVYGATAERMCSAIAGATHVAIAGAGHSVHLERPVETVAAVRAFLEAGISPKTG